MRLMAEFDNYRKRTLREKSELIKNGGESALTHLLPQFRSVLHSDETGKT